MAVLHQEEKAEKNTTNYGVAAGSSNGSTRKRV
jgi:hypothetical protein